MGVPGSGRRPKTRADHVRAGTLNPTRHADLKNPVPTAGRPRPPCKLDALERGAWNRMLWAFNDLGILNRVNSFAIYEYCQLYAETQRVKEQQRTMEASVEILEANIRGVEKADLVQLFGEIVTLRKLIAKCTDQLRQGHLGIRQYLVEFGLTPASLGRIKLPSQPDQVDEFTAYQRGRQAS